MPLKNGAFMSKCERAYTITSDTKVKKINFFFPMHFSIHLVIVYPRPHEDIVIEYI